jgi:predicted NAD-dependent protein-ADP-ribosyltransferase YbiA (DUF1768 family)
MEGHQFASVEHYYQYSKFKKGFPDFALLFCLDNKHEIASSVALAKAAGSKTGVLKKDKENPKRDLRPKNVTIDSDFYNGRNKIEREMAVRAKFTQHEDMKQLLLATKRSKLTRYVVKQPAEKDTILMLVRNGLS